MRHLTARIGDKILNVKYAGIKLKRIDMCKSIFPCHIGAAKQVYSVIWTC